MSEDGGKIIMCHSLFKKSCATFVAIVYSLVFTCCSPYEGTTITKPMASGPTSGSSAKTASANSPVFHYTKGKIDVPGTISTEALILILAVGAIVIAAILLNKPAKTDKTATLDSLEAVVNTTSSFRVPSRETTLPDSLSSFTVDVNTDGAQTILCGNASVTFTQGGWRSFLSFKGIVGASTDLNGPFDELSIRIVPDDVFYVKVSNTVVYRAEVTVESRGMVTLAFKRM